MIKFENTEIMGWESAIRGMRNPMNSWNKSDSYYASDDVFTNEDSNTHDLVRYKIGSNDYNLMKKLCDAGTDHRKFMRMIVVYVDITAPLYWWKEFDTYKVGTVANSCSTMHKIHEKEFTLNDFSHEHLIDDPIEEDIHVPDYDTQILYSPKDVLIRWIIPSLNKCRKKYLETKDKKYWWQMIQLLPSSYNQKRMVMLNYEVLANIYKSRKNHKLDEWISFCKRIEKLPYSELITSKSDND